MIPSTISHPAGEIVLVDFPFTTSGPSKPRPGLVLLDTGDADLVLARITTQHHNPAYDVLLAGWQRAGLLAPSMVRLHKVATLLKSRIQRRLGVLEHAIEHAAPASVEMSSARQALACAACSRLVVWERGHMRLPLPTARSAAR